MLDKRVKFALDNFLTLEPANHSYKILFSELSYEMLEYGNEGKAYLIFYVGTDNNLCVTNCDKLPLWSILKEVGELTIRKCVDHFVLRKKSDHWELHMIEMKRTISRNNWYNVKDKIRASYFTIKALSVFLGISLRDEDIFAYTAYGYDKMSSMDTGTSIRLPTGERVVNYVDEWKSGRIYVKLVDFNGEEKPVEFSHTPIKLTEVEDGCLKGSFSLPPV